MKDILNIVKSRKNVCNNSLNTPHRHSITINILVHLFYLFVLNVLKLWMSWYSPLNNRDICLYNHNTMIITNKINNNSLSLPTTQSSVKFPLLFPRYFLPLVYLNQLRSTPFIGLLCFKILFFIESNLPQLFSWH